MQWQLIRIAWVHNTKLQIAFMLSENHDMLCIFYDMIDKICLFFILLLLEYYIYSVCLLFHARSIKLLNICHTQLAMCFGWDSKAFIYQQRMIS